MHSCQSCSGKQNTWFPGPLFVCANHYRLLWDAYLVDVDFHEALGKLVTLYLLHPLGPNGTSGLRHDACTVRSVAEHVPCPAKAGSCGHSALTVSACVGTTALTLGNKSASPAQSARHPQSSALGAQHLQYPLSSAFAAAGLTQPRDRAVPGARPPHEFCRPAAESFV
jgi:hypothetical protein